MVGRQKGADEVFCRSCGEVIKQRAELCPHCGVRNDTYRSSARSDGSWRSATTTHDPSQYETDVSDRWWYGVAGGVLLWIVVFLLTGTAGDVLNAIGGFLAFVAWAGLPLSVYFDTRYVRANGPWNPNTLVWVVLLSVWVVNIPAGAAYLYRRHVVLGEP